MPTPRKKKTLTKPFVITVAHIATVAFVPGCGLGVVDGGENPPPSELVCPETMPTNGDWCEGVETCDYGLDACGIAQTASCSGGSWSTSGQVICNPPPPDPECPTEIPALGGPCNWMWQSGFGCSYTVDNGCGMQSISVMCDPVTTTAQYTAPTCGQCSTLTTEGTCNTDAGCRWLTPGCGMPTLPAAGCFAVTDCATNADCMVAGQTCQETNYNPCYNKACNACGATANVCLTPEP